MRLLTLVAVVLISGCTQTNNETTEYVNECQERMDSLMLTKGQPDDTSTADRGDEWSLYWYYSTVRYEMRSTFVGPCRVFEFVDLTPR